MFKKILLLTAIFTLFTLLLTGYPYITNNTITNNTDDAIFKVGQAQSAKLQELAAAAAQNQASAAATNATDEEKTADANLMANNEIEITIGKLHNTAWFDFIIKSVEAVDIYAEHTAAPGYQLWEITITQTGTWLGGAIPMGTFDWYLDAPSLSYFIFPHYPFTNQTEMMPAFFWLDRYQTVTYTMLFEAPINTTNLSLNYTEFADDGSIGFTFTLHLP